MNKTQYPTIIAFASSKGGAGKSTSCVNISGALARAGHNVHIIDFDPSQTCWRWYSTNEAAQGIPGLSAEGQPATDMPTLLHDIFTTRTGFVMLDLAGAMNKELLIAAASASLVITPAKLSEPDIVEANKLYLQLLEIGHRAGKPITHRILLNEVPHAVGEHQLAMMQQLKESTLPRFDAIIHQRAAYSKTFSSGVPPHFSTDRQIVGKAVPEVDELVREILAIVGQEEQRVAA
jgi:chromosome partitioning protein